MFDTTVTVQNLELTMCTSCICCFYYFWVYLYETLPFEDSKCPHGAKTTREREKQYFITKHFSCFWV